ncbi:hypothetical protein BKA69DRAFT_797370 [Paraphysoderma sedebokerense]|nr:hypothetical protein BKA69DRAFT_797370 [Paraphysoderma sedebokerense]
MGWYRARRAEVVFGYLLRRYMTCRDQNPEQFAETSKWFYRLGSEIHVLNVSLYTKPNSPPTIFKFNTETINGIAKQSFEVEEPLTEGFLEFDGPLSAPGPGDDKIEKGMVQVIGRNGWSVVSDIDDTIKVTEVLNTQKALENTFCNRWTPVEGMPELYSNLKSKLSSDSPLPFHYVSGSPLQLTIPLQQFISEHYTPGSLDLKLIDLDTARLYSPTQQHKLDAIASIMKRFPQRKFLLIGDSGELDPDTYAKAYKTWQKEVDVKCIWIRAVQGANNTAIRFNEDFKEVPQEKWFVFSNPDDVKTVDLEKRCRPGETNFGEGVIMLETKPSDPTDAEEGRERENDRENPGEDSTNKIDETS